MKNLIFFATLLIFILNISVNVIGAEAKDIVYDPVLDLDGNELLTGTSYYITPTFRPGAGVTIYPLANKTRTYGIAQLVLFGDGIPVTFANGGTDLGEVVRVSTDLTIAFSPGILYYPAVWKVDEYDEAAEQYFVTAGDIDVNETSIYTRFRIRKGSLSGGYNFVSCTNLAQICTDVGIYIYEDVRRFALGGTFPSTFNFKKFQSGTNSNHLEA